MRAILFSLYLTVIVASPTIHAEPIAAPFCPQSKQGINKIFLALAKLNDVRRDMSAVSENGNAKNLNIATGNLLIVFVLEYSVNVLTLYGTYGETLSTHGLCKKEAKNARQVSEDVIKMLEDNASLLNGLQVGISGSMLDSSSNRIAEKAKETIRDAIREIRALY
jgi:hypothetical protein